jgi:menaquinone-specific isochorismate synthase
MSSPVLIDKKSFLSEGAIYAKNNGVWLFWGEPQECVQRPESLALFSMDFNNSKSVKWNQYPQCLKLEKKSAMDLFSKGDVHLDWQEASFDNFTEQFELINKGFAEKTVEKVVPYVFETSTGFQPMRDLESCLHHGLNVESGFLYGQWSPSYGFLGRSPELLIQEYKKGEFKTMAVAGTCLLSKYQANPETFTEDEKEIKEHMKVVQDLQEQLQDLGTLQVGERGVQTTPHLAHLFTEIRLTSQERIEDLVKKLHPTSALGVYPRHRLNDFMQAFERIEPRGVFGAPFGISFSANEADVVVAIRNIIWSEKGLKLGSGCGVVPESQIKKEWNELKDKRESVKKMLGLQ